MCPRLRPHLQNRLIDSEEIFTQTTKDSRHIKSNFFKKILNGEDTFLDMAADSPVPILSGVRYITKDAVDNAAT